jgi:hypothetical protein
MSDQVKLVLSFDIRTGQENAYRRFVLEDFLPQAQEMGLVPTDAWHTAYGNYPSRLIAFVAEDMATMQAARGKQEWQNLMRKLNNYTANLQQRVIRFRGGFQW